MSKPHTSSCLLSSCDALLFIGKPMNAALVANNIAPILACLKHHLMMIWQHTARD